MNRLKPWSVCALRIALLMLMAGASACGPASPNTPLPEAITAPIRFEARVGQEPFACGQSYAVGTTQTTYRPRDFRLYLHQVELLEATGAAIPYTLENDGAWQQDGVALLDFENGSADCSNGTVATRTELKGSAPAGTYTGLRFTLGVPFEKNHQDAAAAQPPLNSTAMFWNWMGGYKFLRADGFTTGLPNGHNLHLGSSGCQAGSSPNSVASCDQPNRVVVTLENFDLTQDTVVADLGALLNGSDLNTNQASSPPGCMSTPTDNDCAPIFQRLGLSFAGGAAGTQTFFSRK